MIRSPAARSPAPDWAMADRDLPPAIAAQPGLWQPLPAWARWHGDDAGPLSEAAFAAGAAPLALDQIARAEPPWLGALRQRQALAAAAVSSRLMRLPADEAALRDAHHLTRAGDDPGPSGRLHRAWRGLAARPARAEAAAGLAQALGLGAGAGAELRPGPASRSPVARGAADLRAGGAGARRGPGAAGSAARAAAAIGPAQALEGEIFGLMLADLVLAETLGWPVPVPLLATTILGPALTGRPQRPRPRPSDPGWAAACQAAYADAAGLAHQRALALARRAARLCALAGTLRSKGGAAGLRGLLADDAIAARALAELGGLGSERAARRFLERLVALGAARELTGRPLFRLYGL